ncbi:hypothetical protein GGI05_004259 [Coemansia sp. RSA 2603]|nr:hypothetical protein GGI05_004259 [Coemansia sp. RSA 2603]
MELRATTAEMQSLRRDTTELHDRVKILTDNYKKTDSVAVNATTTGPMVLEPASFADVCGGRPMAAMSQLGQAANSSHMYE